MPDIIWIIATLCAFFVKGLCGFSNTLFFTSVLSFGNNNINISPVELILTYPANAVLTVKERKSLKWRVCLPLTALVLVGSVPGMLLLKNADVTLIKIIFGAVTVFVAVEMLIRNLRKREHEPASRLFLGLIGLVSGVLCGLYGVGALLGAYVGRMTEDSHGFKANMSFIFVVENTLRVVLYSVLGILTLDVLKQGLGLIPAMLVGLLLGMLCSKFIKETIVRKLVIVMLIISGLSLIVSSL
ncbi:MAG: sulfite exporter TauE/SafE family protein [Clostridia bacterium]|nr:sulfite exporter TauE/SafE family protein [Clostridia bacterium]